MTVACVIPAYRQPGLLAEAIASAMAQTLPDTVAIVVDDGCPMPETQAVAREYAAAHPGRVHVLRQRNAGLSAARNAGIEHALAAFPTLRAVYLLDADNRILRHFLERALAVLEAAPEIGWAYPDIDDLGPTERWDTGGEFRALALMQGLFCDAGSLVARRMLDAGLRFDTTMRDGFEDAEFWLRALRRGFVGRHVPEAGFRYRRRAESMLADSERMRPALLDQLRRRNAVLWRPRALLVAEAATLPRHAIIGGDGGAVRITLDPASPGTRIGRAAWRAHLAAALAAPTHFHAPPVLVFAPPAPLAALQRAGLLHGVFRHAASLLDDAPAVAVSLREAQHVGFERREGGDGRSSLLFVSTRALRDGRDGLLALLRRAAHPGLEYALPGAPPPDNLPLAEALAEAALLPAPPARLAWRRAWLAPLDHVPRALAAGIGLGTLRPALPAPGRRDIAIVQPLHGFGGVERVLMQQARVLRTHGWRPHLVIAERREMRLLPGLHDAYESIAFFPGTGAEHARDPQRAYFGAEVSAHAHHPAAREALGLLGAMDVVLHTHSIAAHALAGPLRRLGVRCLLGLHLLERDAWGAPSGHAATALAYEHAHDAAVVISEQLRSWCIAQGWPAEKLILVRNAPGYDATTRPPARDTAGRRLRALFLGRLDAQKGLDRLGAIIAATCDALDWRVVGAALLDAPPADLGVPVEPPVTDPAALDALFAWADVLVLPSRFEGVPLTVLEAQRQGCVPLATDCGAVAEIVAHAADGWLLPNDARCVAEAVAALRTLEADRARLGAMSAAAVRRLATTGWETNMAPLLAWLDAAIPMPLDASIPMPLDAAGPP